jgi:hypothetical protein
MFSEESTFRLIHLRAYIVRWTRLTNRYSSTTWLLMLITQ